MSLRQLVEGDCGGVNPLMQLGGQFTRDVAHKDEGFGTSRLQYERGGIRPDDAMVNEFLGQVTAPPQSFHMGALLQEMREMEHGNSAHLQQLRPPTQAASVIDEVTGAWTKEYGNNNNIMPTQPMLPQPTQQMMNVKPRQQEMTHVREFFDETQQPMAMMPPRTLPGPFMQQMPPMPTPYLAICPPYVPPNTTERFFEEGAVGGTIATENESQAVNTTMEEWINDYDRAKEEANQAAANYNENFWQRLQDEWQKMSEESEHPWLSEFNDTYDPYKNYEFVEDNPMKELENAYERGMEYLSKGDIPSAVLCFEVAAKQNSESAEVWEKLGLAQAENEMDPQSIAALKRSLELKPDNPVVIMALAICYTNECLQGHALKMLTNWLQINPKYKHLVDKSTQPATEDKLGASFGLSSSRLQEVQNLYLTAVRQSPQEVDADVQQALGVLYNLSSDFDKAVDCFSAALQVEPQNAKLWNRLGASLSNGSRSVEAVEAYQQALRLEPGFIRVRYNVGICCMNLKAYKESVEHLLTALNMQANSAALNELKSTSSLATGKNQMSESIWSTLKMIISLMGRNDLQGYVNDRNLQNLNEAFRD